MEIIFFTLVSMSFLAVISIDTIQKRRKFLVQGK